MDVFHPGESLARGGTIITTLHGTNTIGALVEGANEDCCVGPAEMNPGIPYYADLFMAYRGGSDPLREFFLYQCKIRPLSALISILNMHV